VLLREKIITHLATRYEIEKRVIELYTPGTLNIELFGRMRILEGGDTIRAAQLTATADDLRDATFVRVRY
jgi:hypothetical protein